MKRYVREIGSVSVGSARVAGHLVIRTDEIPHSLLSRAGFVEVPIDLSDDEVLSHYGVHKIYTVVAGGELAPVIN